MKSITPKIITCLVSVALLNLGATESFSASAAEPKTAAVTQVETTPASTPGVIIVQSKDFKDITHPSKPLTDQEFLDQQDDHFKVRNALVAVDELYKDQVSFTAVGRNPAIGFIGKVPNDALTLLAGLPRVVTVVENTGFTESSLALKQEKLVNALNGEFDSNGFAVDADPSGVINVGVVTESADLVDLQIGGPASASDEPTKPPVKILDLAEVQQFVEELAITEGIDNVKVTGGAELMEGQSMWEPTGGTAII